MASHAGIKAFEHMITAGVDVMSVSLDPTTNAIIVQVGDSTNENTDHDGAEWWQPSGFASCPAPPTQGQASCQAIGFRHSDRDMLFAARDLRAANIYANLKPGESCQYATVGAARQFCKANGAVVQYTTADNTESGTSISSVLSPTGFSLVTPWGGITINSSGITLTAGQAALTLTLEGVATLSGTQVEVAGSIVGINGTVGTFLGPAATPTPANGAAYGPGAPGKPGSFTVFISP